MPSDEKQLNTDAVGVGSSALADTDMSSGKSDKLLSVPITLLYSGMIVPDNIYDHTGEKLLITAGNELGPLQLERIRSLNQDRDNIYVTNRTRSALVTKRPNVPIDSRTEIEKETGYSEVADETLSILQEIAIEKKLDSESMYTVSQELSQTIEKTTPSVIMSIINAMAPVDEYLQRHSTNVSLLNGLIGKWMNLPNDFIDTLILVGLMHDCGKVMSPPCLLAAPRKLTIVEYEVMKMHPSFTYEILSSFPEEIRIAASSHHERLDGSGYPKRLKSDAIMPEARITAVSDIYDAMVSNRSYSVPQNPFGILAMMRSMSGKQLDAYVVDVFTSNMPGELLGKTVTMSDGTIGIIREVFDDDIEFPKVEVAGRVIKTNSDIHCMAMYSDD